MSTITSIEALRSNFGRRHRVEKSRHLASSQPAEIKVSVGPFLNLRRRTLRVPSGKSSNLHSNQDRNASRYTRKLCDSVKSSNCGSMQASTGRSLSKSAQNE